eukprot:6804518-Heterocapsa_arctica.AAC.1
MDGSQCLGLVSADFVRDDVVESDVHFQVGGWLAGSQHPFLRGESAELVTLGVEKHIRVVLVCRDANVAAMVVPASHHGWELVVPASPSSDLPPLVPGGLSHGYLPSSEGCRKGSEEGPLPLEPGPCLGIDGDHSVAIV